MNPPPEVSKKRMVIASVLKPVNDTRMFEKWALTLAQLPGAEITVVGRNAPIPPVPGLRFVTLGNFGRMSPGRWLARLKVMAEVIKVKPDIFVVNTHELLIVGILNRILFGTKLVYDIQENYYRNIRYTEAFPRLFRLPLALWVRLKEKALARIIDRFVLAEAGYARELTFCAGRHTIIENKCRVSEGFRRSPDPSGRMLLFSGTLSGSTGVFNAIRLASELHRLDPAIRLTLIGHCAMRSLLEKIHAAIRGKSWIQLVGGDQLVPHCQIMQAISEANFGIVSYPVEPHNENSMPTKIYEYLACRLPMILTNHSPWISRCAPAQAAIPADFSNLKPEAILAQMDRPFYTTEPLDVTWDSEAPRLLQLFSGAEA